MAKANLAQVSFTGGVLGPRLSARIDLDVYATGAAELKNFLPHPHGGLQRRPGWRYVAPVRGCNVVSNGDFTTDTVWTKGTGWVIADGKASKVSGTASDLAQANAFRATGLRYAVTYTLTRSSGALKVHGGATDATKKGGPWRTVSGTYTDVVESEATTLKFSANASFNGSVDVVEIRELNPPVRLIPFQYSSTQAYVLEFTPGGMRVYRNKGLVTTDAGAIVEVASPYLAEHLATIDFTQSADTLYLAHPSVAPRSLVRNSHTEWVFTTLSFTAQPTEWTTDEYPSCVSFFEQRLVFAATPAKPQTIWMSKSGDYLNFTTGSNDIDSVVATLVADTVNALQWIVSRSKLIMGSNGGEWWMYGSSDTAITPSKVYTRQETNYGCAKIKPLPIGDVTLFVQRGGRRIREYLYTFETDGFVAQDLTILAEHLFRRATIIDWAYQQNPDAHIWMVLSNGSIVTCTFHREHKIVAFAEQPITGTAKAVAAIPNRDTGMDDVHMAICRTRKRQGWHLSVEGDGKDGSSMALPAWHLFSHNWIVALGDEFYRYCGEREMDGGETSGVTVDFKDVPVSALDIESILNSSGEVSDKWELITSDEVSDLLMEVLDQEHLESTAVGAYYVDSGLSWDADGGDGVNFFAGLDHLEGLTVAILADGVVEPERVVTNGEITLARTVYSASVGLPYTALARTLRIEGGGSAGVAQTQTKRISHVALRLERSLGGEIGPDEDSLSVLEMAWAPELFSGDLRISFKGGYDTDGQVLIRHTEPLPFNLLGLFARVEVNDG